MSNTIGCYNSSVYLYDTWNVPYSDPDYISNVWAKDRKFLSSFFGECQCSNQCCMQYITAPHSCVYFIYTEQALIDYCKCVSAVSPAIFNLKLCVYETNIDCKWKCTRYLWRHIKMFKIVAIIFVFSQILTESKSSSKI